jgi:hypothetical protein
MGEQKAEDTARFVDQGIAQEIERFPEGAQSICRGPDYRG